MSRRKGTDEYLHVGSPLTISWNSMLVTGFPEIPNTKQATFKEYTWRRPAVWFFWDIYNMPFFWKCLLFHHCRWLPCFVFFDQLVAADKSRGSFLIYEWEMYNGCSIVAFYQYFDKIADLTCQILCRSHRNLCLASFSFFWLWTNLRNWASDQLCLFCCHCLLCHWICYQVL